MFSTQNGQGVPGLGDRAFEVHRLAGSTPVTSTEMAQWRVISPSPGSRDSLVAVSLTLEINSEQNRLSPPTPLILNGESEGFSPLYGKITEMTSFWDNLPQPFFILAPMEAVTDVVFRHVVKQAGAPDVFFTEFANATGWVHAGDKAIAGRLIKTDDEHPLVAQIWGGEPGDMEQFAAHCAKLGFDGIDINMGCPAKSAIKSGGAALIRRPDVAIAAIAAAKTAGLPVSVKTRLGYTYIDEWREWLTTILQQDIVNLTIHLRTKKEMSKVPSHYELIDDIIKLRDEIAPQTLLTINGDIRDRAHGEELFAKYPGLNGIMIGRGVFSDPFCFRASRAVSQKKSGQLYVGPGLFSDDTRDMGNTYAKLGAVDCSRIVNTPAKRSRSISSGDASEKSTPAQERGTDDADFYDDIRGVSETTRKEHSEGAELSITTRKTELIALLHYHLDLFDHYQPALGRPFETLKRFFKIYIRNFDGAKELRDQLMHTKNTSEVRQILEEI